jgi:hypothetical protein
VFQPAALLAAAIRVLKEPRIYAGFDNLSTDGHGFKFQISEFWLLFIRARHNITPIPH